jgi:hypothetical protein
MLIIIKYIPKILIKYANISHEYIPYFISSMRISLLAQVVHILTYFIPGGWLPCLADDPCLTDTNMNNGR